jgi:hypothetical protein
MKRTHFIYRGTRYPITRFYRVGRTMRVCGTAGNHCFTSTHDGTVKGLKFVKG